MERNIRDKVDNYINDFKQNIQSWINDNNIRIMINDENQKNEFIQYMIDFPALELTTQDFQRRKRIKNNIPDYNRCIALKCNGERCSRRQKNNDTNFCGTHIKGSPYGTINQNLTKKKEKVELFLQEINGIHRYIDNDGNIYCTNDIMNNNDTPKIIGTYTILDNNYIINLN